MILEYRKIHNSYITEYSEINTRNDKQRILLKGKMKTNNLKAIYREEH